MTSLTWREWVNGLTSSSLRSQSQADNHIIYDSCSTQHDSISNRIKALELAYARLAEAVLVKSEQTTSITYEELMKFE